MDIQAIVSEIESEIARLQLARDLLSGAKTSVTGKDRLRSLGEAKTVKKRVLSEEARARIAAAQRKRWASAKKAAK